MVYLPDQLDLLHRLSSDDLLTVAFLWLSFPAAGSARCFGVLLWEAPSAEFAFAFSVFFDAAGAAFRFGAAISNRHATVTSRQGKSEAALLPLFYTKEANN